MAYTPNDTLQKQVARGEVWTGNYYAMVDPEADLGVSIIPLTDTAEFTMEIHSRAEVRVQLIESPTSLTSGTQITNYNMERNGTYSAAVTNAQYVTHSGGTTLKDVRVPGLGS